MAPPPAPSRVVSFVHIFLLCICVLYTCVFKQVTIYVYKDSQPEDCEICNQETSNPYESSNVIFCAHRDFKMYEKTVWKWNCSSTKFVHVTSQQNKSVDAMCIRILICVQQLYNILLTTGFSLSAQGKDFSALDSKSLSAHVNEVRG